MVGIAENVLCNLAANIIIGVVNKQYKKYFFLKQPDFKAEIATLVKQKVGSELIIVADSGIFEKYMTSPQVSDLLKNYIDYKITGQIANNLLEVKKRKSSHVIDDTDITNYLINKLEQKYDMSLAQPNRIEFDRYLKTIINCAFEYFVSKLEFDKKTMTFSINNRIDERFINLEQNINDMHEKIRKSLDLAFFDKNNDYEATRNIYTKEIKKIYQKGFIYLMGEYKFNQFYIPPILFEQLRSHRYYSFMDDGTRDNSGWKNIFLNKDIVYVVGGAGYGKSLFMKNIVNNFESIDIEDSKNHLVIYCDLKAYFNGNYNKKSIIDFLQETIINITGIDESKISKDFIQYHLDIGRCIILFDALDEVPKDNREALHKMIVSYFQTCNPNNKVCITSRDRGFIPQDNIEVMNICPLSKGEISLYVDKIIDLKKFKKEDKDTFMQQTEALIEKNFLNNFLVLSLLVNIYKSERELPENKVDLYKKCFEYIAKKREEEKSKTGYNWDLIFPMMKDSTFIHLSRLAAPNNSDIERSKIEKSLIELYKHKYTDECKAEIAVKEFLEFCSNRTELLVLSSVDDKFKFFHRSFFEYFYSRYIYQQADVNDMYNLMAQFDVDSEVFELTVAMIKEDNESKYQSLIKFIFEKAVYEIKRNNIVPFNILTLAMQVVDDDLFIQKYIEFIFTYSLTLINNSNLKNHNIIANIIMKVINKNTEFKDLFIKIYEDAIAYSIFQYFSSFNPDINKYIKYEKINIKEVMVDDFFIYRNFKYNSEIPYYLCVYAQIHSIFQLAERYSSKYTLKNYSNKMSLLINNKKERGKSQRGFKYYQEIKSEDRVRFCGVIGSVFN